MTTVDWQVPWLSHVYPPAKALELTTEAPLFSQLNDVLLHRPPLLTGLGKPMLCVPQEDLPAGRAYEQFIAQTGHIPTRHNLHDLFNACVWLTFPKTKAQLNAWQHSEIEREGVSSKRTPLRDAITLFDENGAVLVTADPNIGSALQQFDWQNSLVKPRAAWDDPWQPSANATAAVYVFGHAMMEQLVAPRKPLCAHTWVVHVDASWFSQDIPQRIASLDHLLQQALTANVLENKLTTRSYQPLPLLGVPHFWEDNADPAFYDDTYVFRSGWRAKKT